MEVDKYVIYKWEIDFIRFKVKRDVSDVLQF